MKKFLKVLKWTIFAGLMAGLIVGVIIVRRSLISEKQGGVTGTSPKESFKELGPKTQEERDSLLKRQRMSGILNDVFGRPKGQYGSGMKSFDLVAHVEGSRRFFLSIDYMFYPLGIFSYEKELGTELSSKIRKLYEVAPDVDIITIWILSPFKDDYGNITWKHSVCLKFDRILYNKINWKLFDDTKLLSICEPCIEKKKGGS